MKDLSSRRHNRSQLQTAMKADLVVAESAVCASWIDQCIAGFPAEGNQFAWWIMENEQEQFDKWKIILHRVKMLVFLAESQMTMANLV